MCEQGSFLWPAWDVVINRNIFPIAFDEQLESVEAHRVDFLGQEKLLKKAWIGFDQDLDRAQDPVIIKLSFHKAKSLTLRWEENWLDEAAFRTRVDKILRSSPVDHSVKA